MTESVNEQSKGSESNQGIKYLNYWIYNGGITNTMVSLEKEKVDRYAIKENNHK